MSAIPGIPAKALSVRRSGFPCGHHLMATGQFGETCIVNLACYLVAMERDLSRSLHALTARLDRAADRVLRAEAGLSYSRFLSLYLVGAWGVKTQRALAELLGVTEPSVSRMIRVLERSELLEASADPGSGNRRRLRLTEVGEQCVERWGGLLEERLANLVEASGIPYATYVDYTKRLLAALEAGEPAARRTSALAAVSGQQRGTS